METRPGSSIVLALGILALGLGLGSPRLWGAVQSGARGALVLSVTDTSGEAISGARVAIRNQQTGVTERTVRSGRDGRALAGLLPAATYAVTMSADGFATTEARDIRVRVTETTTLTIPLESVAVAEEVLVAPTLPAVDLESPATGEALLADTIRRLPLPSRDFVSLLTLSAGTSAAGAISRGPRPAAIHINGQRSVNNDYRLDGVDANDIDTGTMENVPLPNPEAIHELKVLTSVYDASHGRNSGGSMQVGLKPGSSDYHLEVYDFFRNDALNANDFFLNRDGQPRPVLRQNQFGFSTGGPVRGLTDSFVFANYQGTRADSGTVDGTMLNTSLPLLPRDRSDAALISAFFPSGLPAGFTELDPVALRLLRLPAEKCPVFNDGEFCLPSLAGSPGFSGGALNVGSIHRSSPGEFQDDQFTISMDDSPSEDDTLTARWFLADFDSRVPLGTDSSLPFAMDTRNSNRFLELDWTRVFSPAIVNDFKFGFNRSGLRRVPDEPLTLANLGATRPNSEEFPASYQVNVSGAFSIGTASNDDRGGTFNTFLWGDDLSWRAGRHQIRAGFEVTHDQLNRFNRFGTRGTVAFGHTPAGAGVTGIPDLTGFQNFLLGRITSAQAASGIDSLYFRATHYAGYIADDWRIHPRLTLTAGVRWEGVGFPGEERDRISNFMGLGDGTPGPIEIIHPGQTPLIGTPGVAPCTLRDCLDDNNLAPRIGLAWDPFGHRTDVVRAGYGIYFQRPPNEQLWPPPAAGHPFAQTVSAPPFSVTAANPFPTMRPTSDFPLDSDLVIPSLVAFDAATGAPVFDSPSGGPLFDFFFFPSRDYRTPYAQHWNLTLQREVLPGWAAEVGYVGTRGVGLPGTGRPSNAAMICTAANPCVIPSAIGSDVSVPAFTPGVTKDADGTIRITESTHDNQDARVPARFLGLANNSGWFGNQDGQSTYHALETSLTHNRGGSLYLQVAYTWSKSIDNGSGAASGTASNGRGQHYGDLFDTHGNIGLSNFDRTHRFVISYSYELPLGLLTGFIDEGWGRLVHGWSVGGITTYQSGTPFVVYDSGAPTLQDPRFVQVTNTTTLAAPGRAALTSGDVRDRLDAYLDFGAFLPGGQCVDTQNETVDGASPACTGYAAFGTLGRNAFRGPFQSNWDVSISKRTTLEEGRSIEFRTDIFNVWNHASFEGPQSPGGARDDFGWVDVASGSARIHSTVSGPRVIQFALKLNLF